MKSLNKVLIGSIMLMLPSLVFAANTAAPKSKSKSTQSNSGTSNTTGNTSPGTTTTVPDSAVSPTNSNPVQGSENFNNTGTQVYDNRTGGTSTTNQGTTTNRTTPSGTTTQVSPLGNNKATAGGRAQQFTLENMQSQDSTKIIQYARQSGATDAKMEGNTLKITGDNFNKDRFSSLVTGSYPDVNIKN